MDQMEVEMNRTIPQEEPMDEDKVCSYIKGAATFSPEWVI